MATIINREDALRAELELMEDRSNPFDQRTLMLLGLIILLCSAVILPYRNIFLPQELMFGFGVCALALTLPLILDNHDKLILMFLAYMPFSKVVPGTFGRLIQTFNATNVFLGLILLGWAVFHSMRHRPLYRAECLDTTLGLFVFLAIISLLQGLILVQKQDTLDVTFALKRWLTPLFFYFIITNNLRTVRHAVQTTACIALTTGIIGFLGIKEYYVDNGPRASIEKSRIAVTSGPNHLGFLLCSCVFLLIAAWWTYRKHRVAWLIWIPILACLQSMRLTFSRGAQIGFLAGLFCFVFFVSRRAFVVLLLITAVIAANPTLLPENLKGRLGSTVIRSEGPIQSRLDKSAAVRLDIWSAGVRLCQDHPLLGVGYSNFPRAIGHYNRSLAYRDAHNTYLIVATEMGLPALIVFLLLLWKSWWAGVYVFRHNPNDPWIRGIALGFLSMFAAMAVSNLFGSRFDSGEVTVQFYAMIGVIAILYRHTELREALPSVPEPPPPEPPKPEFPKPVRLPLRPDLVRSP